jgi:FMN phosphatase YigB (HAD superfamily)
MNSKNKQLLAVTALSLLAGTAATLYILRKKKHKKRLAVVSNAGYEMAYDVHYPMKYKKQREY